MKNGLIFVLSAPAGTGKTTLIRRLSAEMPRVMQSVSFTTREPRPGEQSGIDYHFITQAEFQERLQRHEFLEHAQVFGAEYGTSRQDVQRTVAEGKHIFLVIDVQGARQVRKNNRCITIFVSPPSMEELQRRLQGRQTETSDRLQHRFAKAGEELAAMGEYDYNVINEDIDTAVETLKSIVIAEEHKVRNN